jgi:hypothetical protein
MNLHGNAAVARLIEQLGPLPPTAFLGKIFAEGGKGCRTVQALRRGGMPPRSFPLGRKRW